MADTFQPIGAVAVNVLAKCEVPIFRSYSKVARGIAHRLARKAVERRMVGQGVRLHHLSPNSLRALTLAYLSAHPELLEQATQIVQGYPKLRKMDEIEERKRERQERKLRKSQGKWGVLDRSVCASGGTEMTQLFSTTSAIFRGSRLLIAD